MRRAAIKELVKGLPNKIESSLFTIPLLYSSSLYILIDGAVIYLGEIILSCREDGKQIVGLVGDDQAYRLLDRYEYCNVNAVVKSKDVYALEASIKIKNFESITKDRWELTLVLTQLGQVVKV